MAHPVARLDFARPSPLNTGMAPPNRPARSAAAGKKKKAGGKKKHSSPSRTRRAQAHREAARGGAAANGGGPAATAPWSFQRIESAQNAKFKTWRSLLTARGIKKHRLAVFFDQKNVAEVAEQFGGLIEACLLLADDDGMPPEHLPATVPCYELPKELLAELDPVDAGPPLLIVRVPDMPAWEPDKSDIADGCTLFLPFQDPINIGAALRSAAAFGVHRAVLCKESAHPFHPRSVQAAGSALFHVPLMEGPALQDLDAGMLPCFALETTGAPLRGFRFPEHFGLVAGLEGTGMPRMAGPVQPVYIPMAPGVDSLNASTATAIALYHWRIHVADLPLP